MIDIFFSWFRGLPVEIQSAQISAGTTILIFILGGLTKSIYERYSLNQKMKREYNFEQRKKIKEILSQSKTHLIKSAEELNYRFWNLSNNIDKEWHIIEQSKWNSTGHYYLKSTAYRLLTFFYWTLKAEDSIYSFDLKQADKEDALYLKYVKTLKHFFCESELLSELGYNGDNCNHHFYKDNLPKFSSYISDGNGVIDYKTFEEKMENDCSEIQSLLAYIVDIKNDANNLNYNTVKAFHLFLILFLNKYGLDYHYTKRKKFFVLMTDRYSDLKIKVGLYKFLERNKVLSESKIIIRTMKIKKDCAKCHINNNNTKLYNWITVVKVAFGTSE